MFFTGHQGNDDLTGAPTGVSALTGNDPNRFQLGGKGRDQDPNAAPGYDPGIAGTGSADQIADRFGNMGAEAAGRAAPVTNYAMGNQSAAQALDARAGQGGALFMINNRAQGGGPSAAALGMAQGNDQAVQSQLAGMAGAGAGGRGAMGVSQALAMQRGVGAGSQAMGQNIANAGQARSAEINGAQGALFGGFQNMRGQDIQGAQMQDARTQHIGNLIMAQRGLNQNAQLNWEGMRGDARNAQLQANIYARMQAQRARTGQNNIDLMSQGNANKVSDQIVGGVTGGGASGAGAYYSAGK